MNYLRYYPKEAEQCWHYCKVAGLNKETDPQLYAAAQEFALANVQTPEQIKNFQHKQLLQVAEDKAETLEPKTKRPRTSSRPRGKKERTESQLAKIPLGDFKEMISELKVI